VLVVTAVVTGDLVSNSLIHLSCDAVTAQRPEGRANDPATS
jgi:hypothetical protein